MLSSKRVSPRCLYTLGRPARPLVFEHITEELLHRRVPYGLSEEEALDALSSDEPQRREQEEQLPKPEQEKGCCQA